MTLKNLLIILQHKLKWKTLKLFRRVKNFLDYAVFIWKKGIYNEYDYRFIYEFMRFKLQRMVDVWSSMRLYIGYEQDLRDMREVVALIDLYNEFEMYQNLSPNPTKQELKEQEVRLEKIWNKFHEIIKTRSRRWWF